MSHIYGKVIKLNVKRMSRNTKNLSLTLIVCIYLYLFSLNGGSMVKLSTTPIPTLYRWLLQILVFTRV